MIDYDELHKLRSMGVKSYSKTAKGIDVEFFEPAKPTPVTMPLDPVSLAKTFSDPMPPDSAMLFASSDDAPIETTLNQSDGNTEAVA